MNPGPILYASTAPYSGYSSPSTLQEKSGVAHKTIWRLENGRGGAQPRTIRKLAAALDVEPQELIAEKDASA